MYKVRLLNTSWHIVTLYHATKEFAFCVLAEANIKDPTAYDKESGFDRLLLEASGLLPPNLSPEHLPRRMADAIASVLVKWHEQNFGARIVMYTGVLLLHDRVHVCTAGLSRVHLVKNGKLVAITRDHNPISDPGAGSTFKNLIHPIRLHVFTRVIGVVTGDLQPECLTWEAEGNYSVLICSTYFHFFRSPEEYLDSFLRGKDLNLVAHIKQPVGVLIRIDSMADMA